MTQKMIMLSANGYSVKDATTNQVNEGITMWFYPADTINPKQNAMSMQLDKGSKPIKVSAPLHIADKIKSVPGIYECSTEMRANSTGQGVMKIVDFMFVGDVGSGSGNNDAANANTNTGDTAKTK